MCQLHDSSVEPTVPAPGRVSQHGRYTPPRDTQIIPNDPIAFNRSISVPFAPRLNGR